MREKAQVMTSEDIRRALIRISHEILERNHQEVADLAIIGIRSRGDHLAQQPGGDIPAWGDGRSRRRRCHGV